MTAAARAGAALLLAVLLLPLGAGIAAAHGGEAGQPDALSLPRILAVEPPVPGLDVVVVEGGARLRIDNRTDAPVTVLQSGAGAGQVVPPGGSVAWAEPRLGDPTAPPSADSSVWAIPLSVGGAPVRVHGDRVWPAPPHPFPWWALTVAALLGTYTVGGLAVERGRRGAFTTALAVGTLVVVAAYVVHVVGAALVLAVAPQPATLLAAAGIGVACVLLGPVAAVLTLRGHPLGPALYGPVGFLAALLTVFDTTSFHRPVLAFAWSFDLDRITTVITVGGGLGLFLVAIAALRRAELPEPPEPPPDHSRPPGVAPKARAEPASAGRPLQR